MTMYHGNPDQLLKQEIISITAKKVVLLQTRRSAKPVFLKIENDEEIFYIRSGPSG